MMPVPSSTHTSGAPEYVYDFRLVAANIQPLQRSGHEWDSDEGAPDPFLRVYRDDELIWESRPVQNQTNPEFDQRAPTNLRMPSTASIRLELWDADPAGEDPIGIWTGRGLPPTALPGANARILLEGRTWLTIRIAAPRAFRGLGLTRYEQRSDFLEVVDIEPNSPAGRSGLVPGDHIVAIDSRRISDLPPGRAASEISLSGSRQARLTIERDGVEEVLELDGGFTWPAR
jgi:hypothetical protein